MQAFADKYASRSLQHCAGCGEAMTLADPAAKSNCIKQILAHTTESKGWSLDACEQVFAKLSTEGTPLFDADAAKQWKQRCAAAFPLSVTFDGVGRDKLQVMPRRACLRNCTSECTEVHV